MKQRIDLYTLWKEQLLQRMFDVAYYTRDVLESMGFMSLGRNVKISDKASIYDFDKLEIGNNSRIDDFCVVSGKIKIGRNVHVAAFCLLAGGTEGIILEDFSGLAYQVQVFTQSDDYSGKTLTNPTVPDKYKSETRQKIVVRKHSIVGAGSIVMLGVILAEGTSVGVSSLIRKSTEEWSIYLGILIQQNKKISKTEV